MTFFSEIVDISIVSMSENRKIFFSAAETSGDNHAAKLICHLREELSGLNCDGLGGPAMARAGCSLWENLVERSAMLSHALHQVGFYFKLLQRVKKKLQEERPDLVVVIDSPAWNFHVAKAAHNLNIPVLYYIAPQLWAWGAWRTRKLRRSVDRVACILPFEEQWFTKRNIRADYVGHPLFDETHMVASAPRRNQESKDFPTIALLPGSRQHEIDRLWLPMQEIAQNIKREFPSARFLTATTSDNSAETLKQKSKPLLEIEIRKTSIEAVTRHADLTLVASGTATLEVAAQRCPMIVMYHVNPIQWHLVGRLLVKTKYICLVNILAQKELVPEFIPFYGQTRSISTKALEILNNDEKRHQIHDDLKKLVEPIIKPGASAQVSAIIKEMLPNW